MDRFCEACGLKAAEGGVFCERCGNRLPSSEDEAGVLPAKPLSLREPAENEKPRRGFLSIRIRDLPPLLAGILVFSSPMMAWQHVKWDHFPSYTVTGFWGIGARWIGRGALVTGLLLLAFFVLGMLRQARFRRVASAAAALLGTFAVYLAIDVLLQMQSLNEEVGDVGGNIPGIGVWFLLGAGVLGAISGLFRLRETDRDRGKALPPPWRDWRVLATAAALVPIFAIGLATREPLAIPAPAPMPTAEGNPLAQECMRVVAGWVDDILAGRATLDQVLFQFGVQAPETDIIGRAWAEMVQRSYQVGAEQATREVIQEVIIPGCEAAYP